MLLGLVAANAVQVDYYKVGPWIGHNHMLQLAATSATLLHCNDSIIDPRFDAAYLVRLAHQTQTPWLSVHIGLPYPKLDAWWQRLGLPFRLISRHVALQRAIQNLTALQAILKIPILIENQAHFRHNGHDYLVDPHFLAEIIQATNAYLLLDIGHAQVSAAMLKTDDYISQLPLARVLELHVHRPGWRRGHLRDLHLPLADADFAQIRQLLPHCPQLRAITLEYYGPASVLQQQLMALRALIDNYSAVPTTMGSL